MQWKLRRRDNHTASVMGTPPYRMKPFRLRTVPHAGFAVIQDDISEYCVLKLPLIYSDTVTNPTPLEQSLCHQELEWSKHLTISTEFKSFLTNTPAHNTLIIFRGSIPRTMIVLFQRTNITHTS